MIGPFLNEGNAQVGHGELKVYLHARQRRYDARDIPGKGATVALAPREYNVTFHGSKVMARSLYYVIQCEDFG